MDEPDEKRKFLSPSPGHRQCEKCSTASVGVSLKGLGRIGAGISTGRSPFPLF
jgi:hypothetical protein